MKTILQFLFLFSFNSAFAQGNYIKAWDYRFGGEVDDYVWCFLQTTDGGFILGGESRYINSFFFLK